MLELLQPLDVEPTADLTLRTDSRGVDAVEKADGAWLLGVDRVIVLARTSRWLSKQWPMGSWVALCEWLLDRDGVGVVVIGAKGEENQCEALTQRFADEERVLDRVGKYSLGETMAVIERCGWVVANDSASLHLAVGLGARSVGLFGPTDPALVGPYGGSSMVVQGTERPGGNRHREAGMDDRFMRTISVDGVEDACVGLGMVPAAEPVA